jgi:hypothetical protein
MAALFNFKSSEVGALRRGGLQRFSVQSTRAISESSSNMNISFCTKRIIFNRLVLEVESDSLALPSGALPNTDIAGRTRNYDIDVSESRYRSHKLRYRSCKNRLQYRV